MNASSHVLPPLTVTWERTVNDYVLMVRCEDAWLPLTLNMVVTAKNRGWGSIELTPLCRKCLKNLTVVKAEEDYVSYCFACGEAMGSPRIACALTSTGDGDTFTPFVPDGMVGGCGCACVVGIGGGVALVWLVFLLCVVWFLFFGGGFWLLFWVVFFSVEW